MKYSRYKKTKRRLRKFLSTIGINKSFNWCVCPSTSPVSGRRFTFDNSEFNYKQFKWWHPSLISSPTLKWTDLDFLDTERSLPMSVSGLRSPLVSQADIQCWCRVLIQLRASECGHIHGVCCHEIKYILISGVCKMWIREEEAARTNCELKF